MANSKKSDPAQSDSAPEWYDGFDARKTNIYTALAACNRQIDAIGKNSRNERQSFNFRGIDDAYNSLHDILAKNGVFTSPRVTNCHFEERVSHKNTPLYVTKLTVEYDFIHESGTKLTVGPVIGEAMDSGDKGTNKALAVAHKYALFQLFTIPTLFSDPDAETHEVAGPAMADERLMADIDALSYFMEQGQKDWWAGVKSGDKSLTKAQAQKVLARLSAAYAAEESDAGLDGVYQELTHEDAGDRGD